MDGLVNYIGRKTVMPAGEVKIGELLYRTAATRFNGFGKFLCRANLVGQQSKKNLNLKKKALQVSTATHQFIA